MKPIRLEIEGEYFKVWAQKLGGQLWVHFQGRSFVYQPPTKQRSRSAGESGGELKAPMPGKVIKVEVQAGQSVPADQTILVLEAMKMEYSLKSEFAGVVDSIECSPGQQVELGQTLARMEKEGDSG